MEFLSKRVCCIIKHNISWDYKCRLDGKVCNVKNKEGTMISANKFKKLIKLYVVRVEGVLCEIIMSVFTSEIKTARFENF